jgi:hypothetical protein
VTFGKDVAVRGDVVIEDRGAPQVIPDGTVIDSHTKGAA